MKRIIECEIELSELEFETPWSPLHMCNILYILESRGIKVIAKQEFILGNLELFFSLNPELSAEWDDLNSRIIFKQRLSGVLE